ncbi:MAG: hypothetical protein GY850_03255 [bacterium]|nr:hypothetical protein [bacterium]
MGMGNGNELRARNGRRQKEPNSALSAERKKPRPLKSPISGPLRDPLIAAGCFAIGLRGSALRAPPIRPMEPTAILSIR